MLRRAGLQLARTAGQNSLKSSTLLARRMLSVASAAAQPQFTLGNPDPNLVKFLTSRSRDAVLREVEKEQGAADYNLDLHDVVKIGEAFSDTSNPSILQSLLQGKKSLLPRVAPTYQAVQQHMANVKAGIVPVASSQWFAGMEALKYMDIHHPEHKKHFHGEIQVSKQICRDTGNPLPQAYRPYVGVFPVATLLSEAEWLKECYIARSKALNNPVREITLKDGSKVTLDVGDGGSHQFFIPWPIVPFFHATCSKIISQNYLDGTQGIHQKVVHPDGTIDFVLPQRATQTPDRFFVCPQGFAASDIAHHVQAAATQTPDQVLSSYKGSAGPGRSA